MLRKRPVFLYLLLVAAIDVSGVHAIAREAGAQGSRETHSGTWSATRGSGAPLMGTWTAVPDSTGGAVTGTWTLADAEGRTVAYGGWSAAKASARWTGAWRGVVAGRDGEYSGTWSSTLDADGARRFADLFENAVQTVVNGTWRAGSRSGAWAIRASRREGGP